MWLSTHEPSLQVESEKLVPKVIYTSEGQKYSVSEAEGLGLGHWTCHQRPLAGGKACSSGLLAADALVGTVRKDFSEISNLMFNFRM